MEGKNEIERELGLQMCTQIVWLRGPAVHCYCFFLGGIIHNATLRSLR
jgi:hypothetical protein